MVTTDASITFNSFLYSVSYIVWNLFENLNAGERNQLKKEKMQDKRKLAIAADVTAMQRRDNELKKKQFHEEIGIKWSTTIYIANIVSC